MTSRQVRSWLVFGMGCLGILAACTGGVDVDSIDAADSIGTSETSTSESRASVAAAETSATQLPATSAPTTAQPTTTVPDPVALLIAELTVDQKIGQLLMPVVYGTDAVDVGSAEAAANTALGGASTPEDVVLGNQLGGVMYLGHNIVDADQVAEFSAGLQAASRDGIGLLIAVDQEGGRVNRITNGVTVHPSARTLSGDAVAVESAAANTGSELGAIGVNVVLAPVADLTDGGGVIGDRSYGADPQLTAEMVVASINGLSSSGVAPAVKHWPGHGATTVDSHLQLPVLDVDASVWLGRERVPFNAAVLAGVDIVMVGHLAIPALDPSGEPASVSPVLLDGLLRRDLGFDGVVMTDALDMGAVRSIDRGELVVRAVLAGVDILLVPPDLLAAKAGLVGALADGRLTEERLDASVERILRLKQRLGLLSGQ